ncbi:MAG: hypothetical protein OEZ06_04920 [Myxococcales bacterium]|nr:hypothetical protein [Myxococcales bacterium]
MDENQQPGGLDDRALGAATTWCASWGTGVTLALRVTLALLLSTPALGQQAGAEGAEELGKSGHLGKLMDDSVEYLGRDEELFGEAIHGLLVCQQGDSSAEFERESLALYFDPEGGRRSTEAIDKAITTLGARANAGERCAYWAHAVLAGKRGRYLEAIRSLDRAPLPGNPHPHLARQLQELRRVEAEHVGTLLIRAHRSVERAEVDGASYTLAELRQRPEGALLRVEPGAHRVRATVEGQAVEQQVEVAAGQSQRVQLELPEREQAYDSELDEQRQDVATVDDGRAGSDLKPYWMAGAIGGGALAVGATAATLISFERARYYNERDCALDFTRSCQNAKSSFETAQTLEAVGFIGAGAVLGAAAVLYLLDGGGEARGGGVAVSCGSMVTRSPGIACAGRF